MVSFFFSNLSIAQTQSSIKIPIILNFDHYHSMETITAWFQVLEQNSNLVKTNIIGFSQEKRPIIAIKIASPISNQSKKSIFINATHHGNERSATESALGFIQKIIQEQQEAQIQKILQSFNIYVIPILNPDGFIHQSRFDAKGRDLNRNYPINHKGKIEPRIVLPEIKSIMKFMTRVHFFGAIALHSGMKGILWPWCHKSNENRQQGMFHWLAKRFAKRMDFTYYTQSWQDYATQGEFIDYAYQTFGTIALTVEVSEEHTPPVEELNATVIKSVNSMVEFLSDLLNIDNLNKLPTNTPYQQSSPAKDSPEAA